MRTVPPALPRRPAGGVSPLPDVPNPLVQICSRKTSTSGMPKSLRALLAFASQAGVCTMTVVDAGPADCSLQRLFVPKPAGYLMRGDETTTAAGVPIPWLPPPYGLRRGT